jgi:branched-subunit amino acid aminotransferase/4-amino-4-deoxychorismate lyase
MIDEPPTNSEAAEGHARGGRTGVVWLNGAIVPIGDASVSAFDAGLLHGVGLFETIGARGGALRDLEPHLDRLAESARQLRLSERVRTEPLADAVREAFLASGLADARVRVTITGGDLNMLAAGPAKAGDPTILVAVTPATRYPEELFVRGARLAVADARLNPLDPFASHKTLNYWPRLSALQQALQQGCDEALWLSVTNHLCGGSVSSLVVVKGGRVRSPLVRGEEPAGGIASPVLPGTTRAWLLGWAEAEGLEVERRLLTIDDLLSADEAVLLNSSWGVLPVVAVEAAAVGSGAVGELATRWRERWLAWGSDGGEARG